ncbi:MAG: oligosaccharide flippase family protein [Lachnospiraceae bacterium]|jgi:O-antigen/teichoic acid export membrane protein|nr:oligosaccharide flippase family protein [Lachnospiraceae bacterium]
MDVKRKKQMSFGILFSYLVIGVRLLSGILYTPIMLRSLGQNVYGVYSLCLSFTGYLTIFNAGMNAAYVRFYVQAKETDSYPVEKINGTFLKLFTAIGLAGTLLGFIAGRNAEVLFGNKILPSEYEILQKSFYVLAITVFLTSVNGIFNSAIIAHEKFIVGKLVDFLHTVLAPVITIPFLLYGYGAVTILVVQMGLTALMLVFNSFYSIKKLGMKFDLIGGDAILLRSITVFAGFITIQAVMDQLNWQVDKFILARVRGADEVAIYSVGSQFNAIFLSIGGAAAGIFIAEINRLTAHGDESRISELFIRTSRIFTQIAVLIMSAFIIFGRQFITRWAGEGYGDSFFVSVLIMLPVTVALSQGLGQDIARAKNLHKTQIVINICVCLLNTIVSIPLAMWYGAVGSAFGTFVCEIVICVVVQSIYYHKVVKINMHVYYREMLRLIPGWVIPFLMGGIFNYYNLIHNNYKSLFIYGSVYMTVYAVSVWTLAMTTEERGYIKRIISKGGNHRERHDA